jgi:signal transduction histidine kinase
VRRRIVTLTVVAAMLAIGLFGLPFAVAVAKFYVDNEYALLERAADSAALSVCDDLATGYRVPVLPPDAHEHGIGLYTPGGTLIAGSGPVSADSVVLSLRGADFASGDVGEDLVIAVPVLSGATITGIVRAATPHRELSRRTALTWLAMGGSALLALATTWLVARRLAARLASPLEVLSSAAERFGDGDFTVRASRAGIAEIDQVAAALNTTADRVNETLERERTFSADVSHQLRTPLTGLRLQLEAALVSPGADVRAALVSGIASADRLERTIDDLLALARQPRTQRSPVDLDALFDEFRQCGESLLADQDRALRVEYLGAPSPQASAPAVRQILGVLLDNAVTHGLGTVTVTARDAGGALAIDVSCEGPGLGSDPDPFEPRQGAPAGHGIGLPLARGLAEAEGGRLLLTTPSPPTFTLLLPVAPGNIGAE